MPAEFIPLLYVKSGCPSCFKLRLFLLEAGLSHHFAIREFATGDAREPGVRAELSPHFAKVTFPTVQYAPGAYQNESDDIVARYASDFDVDPQSLPLFRTYAEVLLPRLRRLSRENKELRATIDAN